MIKSAKVSYKSETFALFLFTDKGYYLSAFSSFVPMSLVNILDKHFGDFKTTTFIYFPFRLLKQQFILAHK